jgi:hypothetical protein
VQLVEGFRYRQARKLATSLADNRIWPSMILMPEF